jgi:hypothetical protein
VIKGGPVTVFRNIIYGVYISRQKFVCAGAYFVQPDIISDFSVVEMETADKYRP